VELDAGAAALCTERLPRDPLAKRRVLVPLSSWSTNRVFPDFVLNALTSLMRTSFSISGGIPGASNATLPTP
jgi:hypothetical protein